MLDSVQLEEKLEQSPAERVTKEYIESRIAGAPVFIKAANTLTICVITVDNGFKVTGESACAKPENYDVSIGEKVSYDNAFNKLWGFFGFVLCENGTLKK